MFGFRFDSSCVWENTGQYSAAVDYINRERFKGRPEPPPSDENNALTVLLRRRGPQKQGQEQGQFQYHVRCKAHVQWLSRGELVLAAAEEGGVNAADRLLTLATEALTEIETRLGAADLDADDADARVAEANDKLHALAGQRVLGEPGRLLAVAQQAAAENRDRVHSAAVAIALEMKAQQTKVDDAEAVLKAARDRAAELLVRWEREGAEKEVERHKQMKKQTEKNQVTGAGE